jgi:hypothetical protein
MQQSLNFIIFKRSFGYGPYQSFFQKSFSISIAPLTCRTTPFRSQNEISFSQHPSSPEQSNLVLLPKAPSCQKTNPERGEKEEAR